MSKTYRRKSGNQPKFSPNWYLVRALRNGTELQAAYDEAVTDHNQWCQTLKGDKISETSSNSSLKQETKTRRRQEFRQQKAKFLVNGEDVFHQNHFKHLKWVYF